MSIYLWPCAWPSHFTGSVLQSTHFCERSECCSFCQDNFCQFHFVSHCHIASTLLAQPASCLASCKVISGYPCSFCILFPVIVMAAPGLTASENQQLQRLLAKVLPISFLLMASRIFLRMAGNWMPSPSKNASVQRRSPPSFTTSPRLD